MLLVVLSYFETFCIQMIPKWSQVTFSSFIPQRIDWISSGGFNGLIANSEKSDSKSQE